MEDPNKAKRDEIMTKLSQEFDEHLQNMTEKNKDFKYDSGITAENFEEEIKKVPAFLNEAPTQEEIEASPALSALQALKYEETDPKECALSHKEDGNYHFKHKKYREAILAYTEGLKQKFDDLDLRVILFTNRAAANFYLENHRSSLKDAKDALNLNSKHMKAIIRGALCCFQLKCFDDCVKFCDNGLQIDVKEKKLLELRKQALEQKKKQDRDSRKREREKKALLDKKAKLVGAIKKRGINIEKPNDSTYEEDDGKELEIFHWITSSALNKPQSGRIFLDVKDELHWPVYFLYPEYNQSDFIEDFTESQRFIDHLSIMFDSNNLPDWDEKRKYTFNNLQVYFENKQRDKIVSVRPSQTLKDVLSDKRFLVCHGAPSFLILSKDSDYFAGFIKSVTIENF